MLQKGQALSKLRSVGDCYAVASGHSVKLVKSTDQGRYLALDTRN